MIDIVTFPAAPGQNDGQIALCSKRPSPGYRRLLLRDIHALPLQHSRTRTTPVAVKSRVQGAIRAPFETEGGRQRHKSPPTEGRAHHLTSSRHP